ncbi:nitrous oxide reductase accessory protein NosL [Algibacter sp. PT7-4]|uniref:nitrous oxide reductase accessory protein NosL n=1 Tax=Algibacter ulvanivorans TaxID=3400999 RepID=UPI003AABE4CF
MKRIYLLSVLFVHLFLNQICAQNNNQCAHCNMIIKDNFHKASAVINNKTIHFDAIECLINYLQSTNKTEIISPKVSNYKTGNLIDANTAVYLISKAIPSPMGANLSAFKNKNEATTLQTKKGGTIYNWNDVKALFKKSKFGSTNHNHHNHYRPDAHAPIGVMGDHLHSKGGLMLSFRYMNMTMEGNKSGTNNTSNTTIYNNYMVAPQEMKMNMYMLGIMYAPSNKITLMLMQNVKKNNMNLTANMMMNGMPMLNNFSTNSSGFGDLSIGALYGVFNNHKTAFHLNGSLSIPVGAINKHDKTPMNNNAKLPYAMQLGSGTFDVIVGATFKKNYTNTSLGTQFLSTIRTGKNSENYRFGNVYKLNTWGAYTINSNISISARLLGVCESKLKGNDPDLNPMMVTTANTNNYGSSKIKSFFGVNISFAQTSSFKKFRLGIEAGAPIYENYNGTQMNENLTINFGLKYNVL